jgi:DNA-directed RNA polymerase subunit omega
MKSKYLDSALQHIPNPELLINVVSRRVRQLAQGHRPLVQTDPKMEHVDIALKEITEGKLSYEITADETPLPVEEPKI